MAGPRTIPTIRLWHLLLVPLQGEIADAQAERLADDILSKICESPTTGLVIDVTGLWIMDSHLCALISRIARAASLMGAKTILCGLSPDIALTLQTMGLQLEGVATVASLEEALDRLGVAPVSADARELGS
jgi:rsbT antagonist protein RsbS